MNTKHVVLIDHVGRNIIGKLVEETATTVTINNPVILHCQPDANGRIQVQSFPVFFFEFIDKATRNQNDWTYSKNNVVTSNVTLDPQIVEQYSKINTPQVPVPQTTVPKIISIDDI